MIDFPHSNLSFLGRTSTQLFFKPAVPVKYDEGDTFLYHSTFGAYSIALNIGLIKSPFQESSRVQS